MTPRAVALAKVKDDSSKYLRLAEEEIVITRHGRPAGVLIGFASEDYWIDNCLEHHPEFLRRVAEARVAIREGRGVPLEDIQLVRVNESLSLAVAAPLLSVLPSLAHRLQDLRVGGDMQTTWKVGFAALSVAGICACGPAPDRDATQNSVGTSGTRGDEIHVFTNLVGMRHVEVNAFQRLSAVVVQKSICQGFGLVVSETLWRGRQ